MKCVTMGFLDSAALFEQYSTSSNQCYMRDRPYYIREYIDVYTFVVAVLVTILTLLVMVVAFCDEEEDFLDEGDVNITHDIDIDLDDCENDVSSTSEIEYQTEVEDEETQDDEEAQEEEGEEEEEEEDDDDSNYSTTTESISEDSDQIYEDAPPGLKRRRKV